MQRTPAPQTVTVALELTCFVDVFSAVRLQQYAQELQETSAGSNAQARYEWQQELEAVAEAQRCLQQFVAEHRVRVQGKVWEAERADAGMCDHGHSSPLFVRIQRQDGSSTIFTYVSSGSSHYHARVIRVRSRGGELCRTLQSCSPDLPLTRKFDAFLFASPTWTREEVCEVTRWVDPRGYLARDAASNNTRIVTTLPPFSLPVDTAAAASAASPLLVVVPDDSNAWHRQLSSRMVTTDTTWRHRFASEAHASGTPALEKLRQELKSHYKSAAQALALRHSIPPNVLRILASMQGGGNAAPASQVDRRAPGQTARPQAAHWHDGASDQLQANVWTGDDAPPDSAHPRDGCHRGGAPDHARAPSRDGSQFASHAEQRDGLGEAATAPTRQPREPGVYGTSPGARTSKHLDAAEGQEDPHKSRAECRDRPPPADAPPAKRARADSAAHAAWRSGDPALEAPPAPAAVNNANHVAANTRVSYAGEYPGAVSNAARDDGPALCAAGAARVDPCSRAEHRNAARPLADTAQRTFRASCPEDASDARELSPKPEAHCNAGSKRKSEPQHRACFAGAPAPHCTQPRASALAATQAVHKPIEPEAEPINPMTEGNSSPGAGSMARMESGALGGNAAQRASPETQQRAAAGGGGMDSRQIGVTAIGACDPRPPDLQNDMSDGSSDDGASTADDDSSDEDYDGDGVGRGPSRKSVSGRPASVRRVQGMQDNQIVTSPEGSDLDRRAKAELRRMRDAAVAAGVALQEGWRCKAVRRMECGSLRTRSFFWSPSGKRFQNRTQAWQYAGIGPPTERYLNTIKEKGRFSEPGVVVRRNNKHTSPGSPPPTRPTPPPPLKDMNGAPTTLRINCEGHDALFLTRAEMTLSTVHGEKRLERAVDFVRRSTNRSKIKNWVQFCMVTAEGEYRGRTLLEFFDAYELDKDKRRSLRKNALAHFGGKDAACQQLLAGAEAANDAADSRNPPPQGALADARSTRVDQGGRGVNAGAPAAVPEAPQTPANAADAALGTRAPAAPGAQVHTTLAEGGPQRHAADPAPGGLPPSATPPACPAGRDSSTAPTPSATPQTQHALPVAAPDSTAQDARRPAPPVHRGEGVASAPLVGMVGSGAARGEGAEWEMQHVAARPADPANARGNDAVLEPVVAASPELPTRAPPVLQRPPSPPPPPVSTATPLPPMDAVQAGANASGKPPGGGMSAEAAEISSEERAQQGQRRTLVVPRLDMEELLNDRGFQLPCAEGIRAMREDERRAAAPVHSGPGVPSTPLADAAGSGDACGQASLAETQNVAPQAADVGARTLFPGAPATTAGRNNQQGSRAGITGALRLRCKSEPQETAALATAAPPAVSVEAEADEARTSNARGDGSGSNVIIIE